MSHFEGRGPTAQKWAKFFNSLISGTLGKLIKGSHGIVVENAAGGRGVTIRTTAPLVAYFYLTSVDPGDTTGRQGKSIDAAMNDLDSVAGVYATPASFVGEQTIFDPYPGGWHPKGTIVCCLDTRGTWEIITPGINYVRGTYVSSGTKITLTGPPHIFGEESEVVVTDPYNLAPANGDTVGATWNPATRGFELGYIHCPGG